MGTRVGIAEFLEKVAKLKKREEKVEALKFNDSYVIRTILQGAFDPRIVWELPEGTPPFRPSDLPDQENVLIRECRRLIHFVQGNNLKPARREALFIELLEAVTPADAVMLCHVKDKKLPWKGITEDIVRESFPNLLPEPEVQKS